MPFLLDTNVWINYLKDPGHEIHHKLASLHPRVLFENGVFRPTEPVDLPEHSHSERFADLIWQFIKIRCNRNLPLQPSTLSRRH